MGFDALDHGRRALADPAARRSSARLGSRRVRFLRVAGALATE